MKNRTELAKYFGELGFKVGAEIGVAYGNYSKVLLDNIPGLKLYCIDSWTAIEGYDHRGWKFVEMFAQVQKVLSGYNCEFIKKFSMDAVRDFKDGSLDFVFIDANHRYEYVKDDIREWAKKVRIGGIVSGHDYYTREGSDVLGVIQAVDEYVKEHGYELKLTPWATGVPKDDRQPSWYFIKDK
jgi:predicted O-methyltransferase YrrM